jgi:hypothetical protein
MKKMRWLFCIALLVCGGCFFFLNLSAQEPSRDAEFIKVIKEYRLNDDGSTETHFIKELKILTHFAFHSLYGETFVVYDPRYQKLTINEAYTLMADGKKVLTPSNAFNEVLPRYASNFTVANPLREMVITHTGLEVGATIYLDYTIATVPDYFPALMAKEILVASSPIDEQMVTVDIPYDSELYYKVLHLRTGPEIFQENGRKRYVWTFSHLAARSMEPFQPLDVEYLPTLIFSTGHNFEEIFTSWTSQEAFQWNVNNEMKERVAKIKSLQADPFRQALDIRKLVIDEFNLFDVPLEYMGYRVRPAEETWNSNGGTEAEKSVLLCALLKEAGIPAILVAAIPEGLMDQSIGCLGILKNFLVQVSTKEYGSVFLSAVRLDDQNLMAELSGHSLVPIEPGAESLALIDIPVQTGIAVAEFQLKTDTATRLTGVISAELKGVMNPFSAIQKDNSSIKDMWTSFASSGHVQPDEIVISTPGQSCLTWKINCATAFKQQDEYLFLELPALKSGFNSWQMNYLSSSRTAPAKIPYPLEESYSISLELPGNLTLVTPPGISAITNQAGSVTMEVTSRKRSVFISRKLKLTLQQIPVQHYEEFRLLMNEWNDMNNRRLVFKKAQ